MELLLQCLVFFGEGCQLLGDPGKFMSDGYQPSYKLGKEGESCCF